MMTVLIMVSRRPAPGPIASFASQKRLDDDGGFAMIIVFTMTSASGFLV